MGLMTFGIDKYDNYLVKFEIHNIEHLKLY